MGLRENEVVVVEEFIWNVKRTARFQLRWDLVAKQVAKGTGEGGGGREKRGGREKEVDSEYSTLLVGLCIKSSRRYLSIEGGVGPSLKIRLRMRPSEILYAR